MTGKAAAFLAMLIATIVARGAFAEEAAENKGAAQDAAGGNDAAQGKSKTLGEIALEGFDTDKDGKISLHELLERVHANQEVANHPDLQGWSQGFKEADADKDMHLNAEELEFLFTNAKKQHRDELVQGIEDSSKAVLEGWDTDKDGRISLLELTERMHNNPDAANQLEFKGWHDGFKEADVDKDMRLDADELRSLLTKFANEEHKGYPLHDEG